LQFWGGVANPQSWERGGRRGSVMVWFERAFVTSYRLFIVTFPLSSRISEILPLLCSSTPLFPTPPSISQKFPMFPWEDGPRATKSECFELIVCAVSFQDFSNLCDPDPPTSQTAGQIDGRRTCNLNTAPVHRAVKTEGARNY